MTDFTIDNGTVVDTSSNLMWLLPNIQDDRPRRLVDAEFEIEKLRAGAHHGYKNWRLPTKEELGHVLDLAKTKEWVDKGKPSLREWFRNRRIYLNSGWYWTCSRWSPNKEHVWCVNSDDGEVDVQHEGEKCFFLAVRTIG